MNSQKTALVILNWNGKHLLERFLPQVLANTPGEVQVIVADNASGDGSVDFLRSAFPAIRCIAMNENRGYAGGYNEALRQVEADFYVLLNSDASVKAGWTEPCLKILREDPGVAAVQPKLLSLEEPDRFDYAGAAGGYLDFLGYPFCRGRIFHTVEEDQGQYDGMQEIFWASGAALFVRAKAFHEASGFDARFFAHMEEIDLCWRLQNRGCRIMACPQSVVFHLGGGSLPASSPQKTFLNFRNSLWMVTRNMPRKHFRRRMAARLMLDQLAAISFLFKGKPSDCLAVWRAHLALCKNYRELRRESLDVPEELPTRIYRRSIVMDYFLRRRKRFSDLFFRASKAR